MALLLLSVSVGLAADRMQPLIHPGYAPSLAEDEQGIWSELRDYEFAIQRSSLRITDVQLNAYVKNAMCRTAGDYCSDLRVYVIRNPYFNASMSANGIVQVWTGLLLRVSSEDELAAVLGHELAHYTQLHSLQQLRRASTAMATGTIVDLGLYVLTGIDFNAGQLVAQVAVMSFSREQENEADLLGVRFLAEAGYDPAAASRVWEKVVAEEARAAVKREQPGLFNQTHPHSSERVASLNDYVLKNYDPVVPDDVGRRRHVDMLNRHYGMLMEDQIDTNRYGRTEAMLEQHRAIGVRESLVDFYTGEMYRQRDKPGDKQRAIQAYTEAANAPDAVPEALHHLGYLYMKQGDEVRAVESFTRYLALRPDTDDRAMIEYHLEEML